MLATNPNASRATLDAPKAGRLTVQYAPENGAEVAENPPRFTWLPVIEDEARYAFRLSGDPAFPEGRTSVHYGLPLNFHTPPEPFDPGTYHWSYCVWDDGAPASEWSEPRAFTIPEGVPETPLASRLERWESADLAHPRLWLGPERLETFRKAVADDPDHCGWADFLERSVRPWMDRDVMPEPEGYPDHKRVASVWRRTYIECQELIYAIRHLAIGGAVTGDAAMTARAKEWLLACAGWSPTGTTSRAYTDEWAFRVNVALAWGYDWLHDALDEEERAEVRRALLVRTRETAHHVMRNATIHVFPFDSHAVRAVSAVLIPASIALLEEPGSDAEGADEAREWLDYSVEFLFTLYSPWGDEDGGWAEGPHYWMTAMAYLLEAANLLRAFGGIDLYARPFFQATGDFPLYTKAPGTRRATFGDDATMGDLPCLKLGYNLRQYAGVTGNGAYQWYFERLRADDPGTEMEFYNWGWWDFRFDELMYREMFPAIEATPPSEGGRMRWFRGTGWVGIQHAMEDPGRHIQIVMKSSPFGSISHSHGDQNAFCLAAFGEDLAIQSGHYVAFNSTMHREWRRQTRSKNAILIDGEGQYAGRDKALAMKARGRILEAREEADHILVRGDATDAYKVVNPKVESVRRDLYFVHDSFLVIVDEVDAAEPVAVDWLLHANAPMTLGESTFRYEGERAGFYGKVLWSEAGAPELTQETGFPGVDPEDYEGLPVSTFLTARYPKSRRHRIATLLVPYPLAEPRRVFSFLDDQGYDCELYFTDSEDRSFKVVVPKTFDPGASPEAQEKA